MNKQNLKTDKQKENPLQFKGNYNKIATAMWIHFWDLKQKVTHLSHSFRAQGILVSPGVPENTDFLYVLYIW